MNDTPTRPPSEGRPVLAGLLALVTVGIVVGLVLGGAVWAGSRMLGLGESASGAQTSPSDQDSLVLPKPQQTREPSDPLITLDPQPGGQSSSPAPSEEPSKKEEKAISLSAGQTTVAPMQQIDLTGVYPGGEGAILQVQRFEGGAWVDFPANVSVSDETFSTYVLTGQTGPNRFRVFDSETEKASNEVTVTIS